MRRFLKSPGLSVILARQREQGGERLGMKMKVNQQDLIMHGCYIRDASYLIHDYASPPA